MFVKALIAGLALTTAGTFATESYAKGTCKDVYVVATNNTGKQIKVIDMNFKMRSYGTKSEPIRNVDIPKNQSFSTTRNLEKAGGRDTKVTVLYRVRKSHSGFDQWTGVKKASSGYAICGRYSTYAINIKK